MPRGVYDRPKAKPRQRKAEQAQVQHPVLNVFPTFSMRQAHALMHCIGLGMNEGVLVDGTFVTDDEWEAIIRQLVRK
jgi:hypothetical protein